MTPPSVVPFNFSGRPERRTVGDGFLRKLTKRSVSQRPVQSLELPDAVSLLSFSQSLLEKSRLRPPHLPASIIWGLSLNRRIVSLEKCRLRKDRFLSVNRRVAPTAKARTCFALSSFQSEEQRPKSFDSSLSLQEGGLQRNCRRGKNMLARQKSEVGFPTADAGPGRAGVSHQKKRRHLPVTEDGDCA
jgi:hypothetical protein